MRKTDAYQGQKWAEKEAAKHITTESIRRRIAHEEEQVRVLMGINLSVDVERALGAHHALIQVLSKRLARARTAP